MQKAKKIIGKFCYWLFAPKWFLNRGADISAILFVLFFAFWQDFHNQVLLDLTAIAGMALCLSIFVYFYVVFLNQFRDKNDEDKTRNTED